MAGNTVILKPSEETPLVAREWAAVLNETLPPNVLQVVHGDERQGKALVDSPIDLVVFTGSREAEAHPSRGELGTEEVILELGGRTMIVLDGATSTRRPPSPRNSFRNAGQVCVSTERIYVDDSIREFTSKLVEKAKAMKVGPGMEKGVEIGPMINARQKQHVLDQLEAAVAKGANVRLGSHGPADGGEKPLTVLDDVTHDMEIMSDETFGPVACVMGVRSSDDAVRIANDTRSGFGRLRQGEPEAAEESKLTAGMIGVNPGCGGADGGQWVGAPESGYGWHGGRYGHRQFCQFEPSAARSRPSDRGGTLTMRCPSLVKSRCVGSANPVAIHGDPYVNPPSCGRRRVADDGPGPRRVPAVDGKPPRLPSGGDRQPDGPAGQIDTVVLTMQIPAAERVRPGNPPLTMASISSIRPWISTFRRFQRRARLRSVIAEHHQAR